MKGGAAVQEAVRDLRKTLVAAGKGEVWEGEQKQEMRERRTREVVYSEMRKSLMEGERMRVREARKEREEAAARERREQEGRRRKDDQERISIEAEERLEALRQQVRFQDCDWSLWFEFGMLLRFPSRREAQDANHSSSISKLCCARVARPKPSTINPQYRLCCGLWPPGYRLKRILRRR